MKIIKVTECMKCPLMGDCEEIKKLPPKERAYLMTSTSSTGAMLKSCHLEDEVVTCGSCKYQEDMICGYEEDSKVYTNHYCSHGKRKESE